MNAMKTRGLYDNETMTMRMSMIVCQWERRVESYGDITVELVRLGIGKGKVRGEALKPRKSSQSSELLLQN